VLTNSLVLRTIILRDQTMMTPTAEMNPRNSAPDITVIVCTYNRCRDLETALKSVAASEVPSSITWEVLVVDNNSTDQTRDVVQAFCSKHADRFRYLFEPEAGKSYALNAAIANARGKVLAFMDDDVTVEPTWLHNLTASLHDGEWAGAGGRTLPAESFIPPPWLPNDFKTWGAILCAYFDHGDEACEIDHPPYGANMAFRSCVFERHGGFRIDLGPAPGSQIRNEDSELGRRLLTAGERLRYEPTAVVYHPVPQGRITKEYFCSWWFDFGRARIREIGVWPDVYGIRRDYLRLLRCVMRMPALTLRWMLAIHPQDRFRAKCRLWHGAGMISELYCRSVDPRRKKPVGASVSPLPRPDKPQWWT